MNSTKSLKKLVKYLLPIRAKKGLKYLAYSFQDLMAFLLNRRDSAYPPKRLNFVGSAEFKKIGDEFTAYFIKLAGLKAHHQVLDVGCGIGRMAIPLTKYLNQGEFYGFDIDKRGIDWCQKHVSTKYPNFHFQHADIFNKYYNKKGKAPAENFQFSYADEKFDFVFATSVFTHMLPAEVRQYFSEIRRVLKSSGKLFLTFFSIDDKAAKNLLNGLSYCNFQYPFEGNFSFYSHKNVPEAEIGYTEQWLKDELNQQQLANNLQIHHGSWSGRLDHLSYQDIFISEKA